jgi:hypothetical protein
METVTNKISFHVRGSVLILECLSGFFTDKYRIDIVYEWFFPINKLSLYTINILLYYHYISRVPHIYSNDPIKLCQLIYILNILLKVRIPYTSS